jgi:hypothetical protein
MLQRQTGGVQPPVERVETSSSHDLSASPRHREVAGKGID